MQKNWERFPHTLKWKLIFKAFNNILITRNVLAQLSSDPILNGLNSRLHVNGAKYIARKLSRNSQTGNFQAYISFQKNNHKKKFLANLSSERQNLQDGITKFVHKWLVERSKLVRRKKNAEHQYSATFFDNQTQNTFMEYQEAKKSIHSLSEYGKKHHQFFGYSNFCFQVKTRFCNTVWSFKVWLNKVDHGEIFCIFSYCWVLITSGELKLSLKKFIAEILFNNLYG